MRNAPTDIRLKSRAEQLVEHRHGASIEALLRRLYEVEGMSQREVAATLGVGLGTVNRWMIAYGVQTRDRRALAATA